MTHDPKSPVGHNRESRLFYQSRSRRPLIERSEGVYMWDVDGKRYIDASSGAMVSNIGHSDPRVIAAMTKQLEKASFAYRLHFENDAAEDLAIRLADRAPGDLERVFFVSGGSEAVESCIKLARQYALAKGQAQRTKIISRFPSYHGATLGALAITGYTPMHAPFAPMMVDQPKIPAPTCYLDRDDLSDHDRGIKYANMLEAEIIKQGPETVLGFIMEPVGGAATGALVAPDSYYGRIREICDQYGILLIYDEVMTGAGRTGKYFAAEHWGIVPDILAVSKGLAAGYAPLGAMIAPDRIVGPVLDHGGFIHGYTYAGNPLACAAGNGVLDVIEEDNLLENAATNGAALKDELTKLADDFAMIGDVRGKGLLLAIELVKDRDSMEPIDPKHMAAARLVDIAYDMGLIIYWRRTRGGYRGDHVMVCPPMTITKEQFADILVPLRKALSELQDELEVAGAFA
ncbi:MAG: aspartate aminotransferase family protein [Thalassospira sp.]|uniref:aminotransferase family protein n=1 Tax=Thalassospira sp. TaxID=1912094 RepID=UPI001B1891EA|nr:aspartate aminotransferase family protein [Thalassospira sp.]MBO6578759.1 aspartate aminotransferase family protein [Thalassospira sp.]MBO6819556.1 aspartate aminotransferase family protein [Thalassospira sp.]MBO6888214.1 aspartate aminotransferase family protein [Thalassospira sp.]